jgi:hypothetical protein
VEAVIQQILIVFSQLCSRRSDCLSRSASNRRICWLTSAALRIVSRFAIQPWLTVLERAIAQARLPIRGSLPRLILSHSLKPSSFKHCKSCPRLWVGHDHGPDGYCGNSDSSFGATVTRPFSQNASLPPKGLSFYGPPGCGKTETARFLSKNGRIFVRFAPSWSSPITGRRTRCVPLLLDAVTGSTSKRGSRTTRCRLPVRDYLGSVLPGLANFPINRIAELTPSAMAARN